jgi:transcriptional regulator
VYVPRHFRETDSEYIRNFITRHSFATLVSSDAARPVAAHVLMDIREADDSKLILSGHVARANPLWKTFGPNKEVLVIFSGPHAYVSAGWYSIKSAPTWNYINVHLYGVPRLIEERVQLYRLLKRLVDGQEKHSPDETRFRIEDLPEDTLDAMMNGIVGFEIEVTGVEAAAKLSQNRSAADYDTIIGKLLQRGDQGSLDVAREMQLRRPGEG